MSLGSFKNVINKIFTHQIYLIKMYQEELGLNNLKLMICHDTKANQINRLLSNLKKQSKKY